MSNVATTFTAHRTLLPGPGPNTRDTATDCIIEWCNDEAVTLLGYTSIADLIGRPLSMMRPAWVTENSRVEETARTHGYPVSESPQQCIVRPDGEEVWVRKVVQVLRDGRDKARYLTEYHVTSQSGKEQRHGPEDFSLSQWDVDECCGTHTAASLHDILRLTSETPLTTMVPQNLSTYNRQDCRGVDIKGKGWKQRLVQCAVCGYVWMPHGEALPKKCSNRRGCASQAWNTWNRESVAG